MARKTFHFKGFSVQKGNVKVDVKLDRYSKQFQDAQFWLDSQIMHDMKPYMPMQTGNFIQRTSAESTAMAGSGQVCAGAAPMGRFLYTGQVMVDPVTGSPWARPGAKKVVTSRPLKFANPQAVPFWFDKAKEAHGQQWVEGAKKRAGGGK